ncbi:winged helix DNA-binding domain-containing protein [Kribbella sp. NPDC051770]|uniref:winged helix DNA-binding domain-containing protein n=1 Tax=Kribbella sp. NPDC051770 TaxID=3155413 RepID=UPI00342E8CE4
MTKLTLQALNRATLHRQWLTTRHEATPLQALEHLVGMQAQSPQAPYVGLWSRLADFNPTELSTLLETRAAVRGSIMRATIHLMSSRDFLAYRALFQPRLDREIYQNQTYGRHHLDGLDIPAVLAAGQARLAESPATPTQLRTHLAPLFPNHPPASLAHAIRCLLPTLQTPPRGLWHQGSNPTLTTADLWLNTPITPNPNPAPLILRYLNSFGPASIQDTQTWSGLTHLSEVFPHLPLRTYTSPTGQILYDLPDTPLPPEDLPVPVRFLPEYDNLLLSHQDRTRFIPDATRKQLALTEILTRGAALHNGQVTALWKLHPKALEIQPITKLAKATRAALESEARQLLAFAAPESTHEVKFLAP